LTRVLHSRDFVDNLFISLDGLDGTGKSTQCRLLAEWLRAQGYCVLECKDPGGTAVGDVIRSLVLEHRGAMNVNCEAFLFMASRAQLVAEVIRPALTRGEVVVCDRFTLANVVYQGHAGGLDPATLWTMSQLATGGLEPDLTIVLDLPVEKARERRGRPADRMESRAESFHERVRAGFLAEAARQPDRIRVVDASPAVEVVQESIRQEVCRAAAAHTRP
jgi:dTMP kinase